MKVVTSIATKGGVGKTLLAIHLACEAARQGVQSMIIDLDPQCSSTMWGDSRKAELPVVTSIQPQRLQRTLAIARDAGVDIVFVDSAPHTSSAAISAAEQSDLVIIPCRPSILDLRALLDTSKIVQLAQTQAYVVLNVVPHNAPKIEKDARSAVLAHGLSCAPIVVHSWAALSRSLTFGKSIQEFEPTSAAASEIERLCAWIGTSFMTKAPTDTPTHERVLA